MPLTYDSIVSTTLTSTSTSVSFTSITGTYTDLVLIFNGSYDIADPLQIQFNSDTGTNYSRTRITGDGSNVTTGRSSNSAQISIPQIGTSNSTIIVSIFNYSNTTTYKSVLGRGNTPTSVLASVGMWRSTSAITSMNLAGGTFSTGSTFSLYGIKGA